MRLPARYLVWVLPLLLTGCFHKNQQAKAPAQAPTISDADAVAVTPVNPPPAETSIAPIPPATEKLQPVPAPKPPPKPPKPAPAPTQQASNPNPGVSAIGELSSGGPYDVRRQAEDSIVSTERSLNGINRTLSDPEQKTAQHIREFLKEARTALASGDVDGAKTLAAKAKVLLSELTR